MKMGDIFSKRRALRALGVPGLAVGVTLAAAAVHSEPRSRISPYLEFQQVLTADLNDGDVLTYSAIGAGVDGYVQTRRVEATMSYNYQRRFGWEDDLVDEDVHTGLAAARIHVIPNMLTFDAGALATRSHADIRSPIPAPRTADDANLVEIYSAYAGPTLSTRVGSVDLGASYRLGYVHVDDDRLAGGPGFEDYGSSTIHSAQVSAGMAPGELPFGWTVGAGYAREDADRLDSTNESKFVRGDVVVPVSPTLAVTAGVGYEKIKASQQDILRNAAGLPVVDARGELIADPSRPRLVAYDESGLIWDAGVIWRPSPRTELQARVGQRYGGTTFVGSLEHRINQSYALTASVYDNVTSFGQLLVTDLSGLPVRFNRRRNDLLGGFGGAGCVFGTEPGTGRCFDDALQSINSATFRNRGANVAVSGGRGPWEFGVGAGYANREYLTPDSDVFTLNEVTDQSFTLQANASRALTRTSGLDFGAYAGWYDSGLPGAGNSWGTGINASYHRTFMERLQAEIAAGLYHTDAGQFDSTAASILFGLRYSF